MILIGQFDSVFVRRVAVALHHYGLPFEHRPWSVWAQAEELAKQNPLRRVPVLVTDEGETLVESFAILDAIDEWVPEERRLLPKSGAARRAGLRVSAFAMGLADKSVSLLYERVLRDPAQRSDVWIRRCEAQIGETLDFLEKERAAVTSTFWLGSLSHADIAVTCAVRFVGEAQADLLRSRPRPALAAHCGRCEAMPVFQSAVQALHLAV